MQCAGCQKLIADRYVYMIQERMWHGACIVCCECRSVLREHCYHRDGKYFCRKDFFRLFGTLCSGCGQGIAPDCLIHRFGSKVYHRECLNCEACGRKLETGDVMRTNEEGVLVCQCSFGEEHSDQTTASKRTRPGSSRDECGGEKISDKEKARDAASSGDATSHEDDHRGSSDSEKMEKADSQSSTAPAPEGKRRGPRTTIKARQLEMLKSAFNHAPKPSRQARERLAKETGLTMRVIQVWFQNRRSKERRMRQLDNTGKSLIHGHQPGMQQGSQQLSYPPTVLHQHGSHGFYPQHTGQYHSGPVHYSQQLQSHPAEQSQGARGPLTVYHGQVPMPPPPPESNVPFSCDYNYSVPHQTPLPRMQTQRLLHRPPSQHMDMLTSPQHLSSTMRLQHTQDVRQLSNPSPRKLSTTSSAIWIPQQPTVMDDCTPPSTN